MTDGLKGSSNPTTDDPTSVSLLNGLRVVEVAILAPSALGGHLAELGADVVKVESGRGDYIRSIGVRDGDGTSTMHKLWNRGKRSIELDLSTTDGREAFRVHVASAEVVIEGRRPGYLARFGLGYEELLKVNPTLVFICLSGFGSTGPYASLPSHGPAFDAYAGLLRPIEDIHGRPRIPRMEFAVGVTTAPVYAAMATLSAVIHTRATGQPVYLDVAQADAAMYARATELMRDEDEEHAESVPGPAAPPSPSPEGLMDGDLFEDSVLVQYYRTADDRYVLFQAMEPALFRRFSDVVGHPDLASAFPTGREADWLRGDNQMRERLSLIFAERTSAQWIELSLQHGLPCTPVNFDDSLKTDPHFRSRVRWLTSSGARSVVGLPIRSQPPLRSIRPAPESIGQDSMSQTE
ncbi:CoA transferase [Gordonia sp. ABSL11-1]|uniref:CaiB/BaiF CoA transferase family protein n=1 Tax=Gordonia sp. ABSL11-1 TaxID=3053924 RepID=UPI00257312A1|nr:CoA transferase [Gordonia sp. ABSL11-1]MDL9945648.1 CoA transferase [Gordonia sp. ABSL11-1]